MTHHILALQNFLQSPISEITNAIIKFFEILQRGSARHRIYVLTIKELERLSDKELADIGLHRGDIEAIARHTAYGKVG